MRMVFKRLLFYLSRGVYGGWGDVGDWVGVSDGGGERNLNKILFEMNRIKKLKIPKICTQKDH